MPRDLSAPGEETNVDESEIRDGFATTKALVERLLVAINETSDVITHLAVESYVQTALVADAVDALDPYVRSRITGSEPERVRRHRAAASKTLSGGLESFAPQEDPRWHGQPLKRALRTLRDVATAAEKDLDELRLLRGQDPRAPTEDDDG